MDDFSISFVLTLSNTIVRPPSSIKHSPDLLKKTVSCHLQREGGSPLEPTVPP
jgi:hypothetical protein